MRNAFSVAGLLAMTLIVQAERPTDQMEIEQRDGKWVMTLRHTSPGADGVQFLIEDLRLAPGSALLVYEVKNGARGEVRGRYTGSGPLQGDPFWSDAVLGSESLLEVVFEQGAEGTLPFRVAATRVLDAAEAERIVSRSVEAPLSRPELEGTTGMAQFRGATVPFTVREGMGVFEGDILLGRAEELVVLSGKEKGQREGIGITSTSYRWPGGVVPYVIDPAMPSQNRVTDAVAHWNTKLAGSLTVVPRTSESYYIKFVRPASAGTCSSYIGNIRMANQPINLGDYCSTGNAIHEIGHAIGLYHEQSREDRDTKVSIQWANITSGYENNFQQAISTSDDLGSYDYGSIMHYGATAFSSNGLPTIVTIPAGIPIGQRSGLSSGDVSAAQTMYPGTTPPPPTSTVAVSFAVNLSGPQLVIDGSTVTAPVTYQWTVGSVHTVNAPNLMSGNTRYVYASWSDGGAQSHSITTPSAAATYTANYTRQYKVTTASSDPANGTVTSAPSSADSFYNDGTSLSVSATALGSACFSSWSGITAPATTPLQVTANQSYAIVGNFQTGAVSVSPASVSLGNTAQTVSLSVTSSTGCTWTVTEAVSWISLSSGGGSGSRAVAFNVTKNNSKSSRSGVIKVGGLTVSVTQAGR